MNNILWRTSNDWRKLHAVKRQADGGLERAALCGEKPFGGWWPKNLAKSTCEECERIVKEANE